MNALVFLPFGLLLLPFIPSALEFLRRKDKGPRHILEQTTQEEKPDLTIPRLERARGEARIKGTSEVMRITGNVGIPEGAQINCSLVVQGGLELGRKCHVAGSIKAFGNIQVGESSVIEGHVLSEGKIVIGRNCLVEGVVDSPQDIVLEDNAVVEAVTTGSAVRLGLGARINKRVVSGASIMTTTRSPTMEEHPQSTSRQTSSTPAPATRRLGSSVFTETGTETVEPTGRIEPADLNETEARVLRLARAGRSLEEMGLRLLMDPSQIQEIVNRLVGKGYLDGNLKSKREKTGSDFQTWRLEKAEQPEHKQPPVFDSAIGREHPESREDLELQNASREAAGALIASKMRKREQGKRKIRSEWDDASSFLWKNGEKDERYPTNGILSSDDSERTESRVAGAKHDAPQSAHRDHGGRSAESEELRKSIEAAKELCGSPLEPSPPKRMIPIILLPLSALVALLLAEVTYYSPGFAGFLNNILPLSMQAWVVFVILALGLGLASGVSAFRHLNRYGREANSD